MSNLRIEPVAPFLQRHPAVIPVLFLCITCIVYCTFSMLSTGNIFMPTHTNYYIYQLDAFAHGRVNVMPPYTYDLSLYHNKWYLYWGPAPVLLLWPFYVLWGLYASDVFFTMLGGLANVILITLCVHRMKQYFHISLSPMANIFLLASFAFASPNFALSLAGGIWATSQIFATTFLLLFYLFFLKYLNNGKQSYIVVSVAFFCLACLSRYSLLFHGLLFIYLFWDSKAMGRKISRRLLIPIGITVLFFLCLGAFYNYLKFQNIFEVGQRFQQGAARYDEIVQHGPILSFQYFWHNFYYYFLNPIYFSWSKHQMLIDREGNSVLMVYPSLLLCLILFVKYRQFDTRKRCFVAIAGVAALITVLCLMFYFATGWMQFGNRYFFDAYPLFFLLLVLVMPYVSETIQWMVMIWGVVINFLGLLTFFSSK